MRYIILVLLNLPVISLALLNIITQYKLKRITKNKFAKQIVLWTIILVILILSFPVYNLATGKPVLDSSELSLFDIVEITAIIFITYVVYRQRQILENTERRLRDLHQELSIKLSDKNGKN